jgi:hypothetical protein
MSPASFSAVAIPCPNTTPRDTIHLCGGEWIPRHRLFSILSSDSPPTRSPRHRKGCMSLDKCERGEPSIYRLLRFRVGGESGIAIVTHTWSRPARAERNVPMAVPTHASFCRRTIQRTPRRAVMSPRVRLCARPSPNSIGRSPLSARSRSKFRRGSGSRVRYPSSRPRRGAPHPRN